MATEVIKKRGFWRTVERGIAPKQNPCYQPVDADSLAALAGTLAGEIRVEKPLAFTKMVFSLSGTH